MHLNFNDFGKVKKEEIVKYDLPYTEEKNEMLTYSELKIQLKKEYGIIINWDYEERIKHCQLWLCSKRNRGCSPLYIADEVFLDLQNG